MVAIQSGMGIGIGKTKTRSFGTIMAKAPPMAKIAPEAPTPGVKEGPSKIYKMFPSTPPAKYTLRKSFSPTILSRKLPRKYRLIILNMICRKPAWTKRLLIIVHGWCRKYAGVKPSRKIASGCIRVIIKIKTFAIIRNHRAFNLKEL